MAEAEAKPKQLKCLCGEDAVITAHLAGEVVECDQGFQHQQQYTVPLCGLHDDARLSGQLDGLLLLAAAGHQDSEMRALLLRVTDEPSHGLTRVTAKDDASLVSYEPQSGGDAGHTTTRHARA